MDAFTKLNRDEVPNAAESFGMADFQDSRFFGSALDAAQTGLGWHRIHPGKRSPIAHRHRAQEELYVVVAGSGRAKLDEEVLQVAAGDVLRVAPQVARGFEAGDDGLEVLAFGAPVVDGDARDKGELLEDFWS